MEKTYTGKINNKGNQTVKSLVNTGASKSGKMITGGDLRSKKSSK